MSRPLTLPVVGSPLFIASGPDLVVAQCRSGVIGSFPALNARPASLLSDWLDRITEKNASYAAAHPDAVVAPFAVNQIVHRSNDRLEHDMEVIVRHRVPLVITSLGARPEINEAVRSYGGIVLHDVTTDEFARKAVDKGADGIIAVAAGAGGHGYAVTLRARPGDPGVVRRPAADVRCHRPRPRDPRGPWPPARTSRTSGRPSCRPSRPTYRRPTSR
ncbi:NAD(P)H-dependent flavin oxidoreductase [Streptomyces phaeofaciens]|uniref:NAD(P)H-dependent flavin oxidoreductase n=1 Tax=Streptomyces phaeofaciens TaxID=68254 RepID=UPI001E565BDE|nr:hypothetical protein [Streptomyces phaeofaciens]